jgi:hypothetical protein
MEVGAFVLAAVGCGLSVEGNVVSLKPSTCNSLLGVEELI